MLEVTLSQGKVYQLPTRSPVQLVSGRGTYGNGSIDWEQEGLTIAEIIAQVPDAPEGILAALVNGRLLEVERFVSHNCIIEWVTAADELGRAMLTRSGIFLLAYGLSSLHRGYQRLGGGLREAGLCYYDFLPPADGVSEQDLAACRRAVAQAVASGEPIKAKKLAYYPAVDYFEQLGEADILRRIEENDDGGAVSVQMWQDFAELDTGMLVKDLRWLEQFQVLSLEQAGAVCRLTGKLP